MADRSILKAIRSLGSDWIGEQVVRLGDDSGDQVVETGVPGELYARQNNGRVIRVINSIFISPDFDTRVLVRRSRTQPNVWRIAEALEDYTEPVSAGRMAYHHEQHEESGPDRLVLDRKQIKQLSARAAGGFNVQIFGGYVQTGAGIVKVSNELLDFSSYAITAGAKYVSIEVDEDGALSLNEGDVFASPPVGTEADIPAPAAGMVAIYYVLIHEGQTAIIDNNIRPILLLSGGGSSFDMAAAIHAAGDEELSEDDEIGFWEDVSGLLKKITVANLFSAISIFLTDIFSASDHTHEGVNARTIESASDPTVNDDTGDGYHIGDIWSNTATDRSWILLDPGAGAAVWKEITNNDSGWLPISQTLTYSAADDPVYTIFASGNVTADANYKLGNKIKFTNNSTTFFGFIVKVGAYDSGNNRTPVDVYGGTDYDVANSAITAPYISKIKSPDGFPLDPEKWTVTVTDSSNQSQASPNHTTPVIYNLGSISISIPIGSWRVNYKVLQRVTRAASTLVNIISTLSTANNSASDPDFNSLATLGGASGTLTLVATAHCLPKRLALTSKTTYYLNAWTTQPADSIGHFGASGTTVIKAICAYL